jgi:NAD(P)-dependent dehydrogenase (short-subunit alcohol dehydrogenase family)
VEKKMPDFVERAPYLTERPVALIIGCGDMGMGCARVLGRDQPLLMVDINAARLETSVAALQHEGYNARAYQCDISQPGQVEGLAAHLAAGPGIKVLAHVAAIGNPQTGWRDVMDVDLLAVHLVARAIGPLMVRGGVAILISSTGSYRCPVDARIEALIDDPFQAQWHDKIADVLGGEPDFLEAYFLAKQGMNRLAQRLAIEWGPREVRAVSLSPGLINSTMGRTGGTALPVYDGSGQGRLGSRSEKAAKEVPLGRQGTLLEITAVVGFLASDAASFISGIDIPVDGGSTAMWRAKGEIAR